MPVAKSSPAGKILAVVESTPTAQSADTSVLEKLAKKLSGIEVHELKTEKDIESFLVVAAAIKNTLKKLTPSRQGLSKKWKEKVDKQAEKLTAVKSDRDEALQPFKDVESQLKRIDGEAREAVTEYAENRIFALEEEYGELSAAEAALVEPATQIIEADGAKLYFKDVQRAEVTDLKAVPDQFIDFQPDEERVNAWLSKQLGMVDNSLFSFKIQKNGKIVVELPFESLPEELFARVRILESKVVAAGGCDGVQLIPSKSPVVKTS